MSEAEFASFLTNALKLSRQSTKPGAVIYDCKDIRHMGEILSASRANSMELLNLCVWVKTNGGMGSFYRSGHELVFVFCNGGAPHRNNIQLGRFGRNRTNVWNYAGAIIRPPKGAENLLSLHPTVKPVMLVADAIRDSTVRGDIVLDPFAGSGTLFLAAERVQRRGYGMEIDPDYVDTAILRWQRKTGKEARHRCGATFNEVKCERSIDQ
jgi:DNA modification methylase